MNKYQVKRYKLYRPINRAKFHKYRNYTRLLEDIALEFKFEKSIKYDDE